MKVGFIGLGHMGSAMASNLAKAGHELTVFNRSPGKSRSLLELGAREAADIAAACHREVVITMLEDDAALADVAFASEGLIANLSKGAIHISMSTIGVALSRRLAQAHRQAGQCYLAAPVFGRPDKLTGNFLQAVIIEALGEAIALIGKAGIDRSAYVELLTSTVFTAPPFKIFGPLIAEGKFEPALFAAPLGYKDIRLALAEAENLRVPMPLASLVHDRFVRLFAQGGEGLDWTAIGGLATQDAGDRQAAKTSSRPPAN